MLLTLNNKEYTIPSKWSQVTISSYQKFMLNYDDKQDDYTKTLNTISAFIGVPFAELEKCKKSDIDKVDEVLAKLLQDKTNEELNLVFIINDKEYGFHPNLQELTFAEFVDLDNYLKEPIKNLHLVMSVLYREIVKKKNNKYTIVDYDSTRCIKNAELFKENLSVATTQGASSFFLIIGKELQKSLLLSSNKQQKKMKKTYKQKKSNLATNGVGIV
jgi:hypothetical protein